MSQLSVLLIDDNPDDRVLVARELRKVLDGVRIDEVGQPAEFDILLRDGAQWDVAVSDYQLRWSDGLQVFRRLRAERPGLPVILFTASGTEEIAVAALKEGVDDYVTKTPRHYGRVPYAVQAAAERRQQRQQAEAASAALQRSEVLLKLALEAASMDVWEFDRERGQLQLHGSSSRFAGGARQVPRELLLSALHREDAPRVREHFLAASEAGRRFDAEFRVVLPGGVRWVRAAGIPDGGSRVVGVLEDVTERKQMLERLREADRRKDQFIATLGHELRNPLAPIGYAVRLLTTRPEPPVVARAATVIERQVDAMGRLLDQLLDLGRIVHGRVTLQRSRFDLRDVARESAEDAQPQAAAAGLQFAVDLPPGPVEVDGDRVRLKQVFDNLLHNAVKYTSAGGRIGFTLVQEDGHAVLLVEDQGLGIPVDMLERIFEPLVQVQAGPDAPRQGGLGIGLAVVKHLVELHGGTVRASSGGAGAGARFELRLPACTPEPMAAKAAGAAAHDAQPAGGLRVLIADDQPDAADALGQVLAMEGYEVRLALDGLQAQAVAADWQPEVMVLDIGMPGATGDAVARWARQQPWGGGVRLVALTGWGREEDRARLSAAGFDDHLVKPVAVPELLRALRRPAGPAA